MLGHPSRRGKLPVVIEVDSRSRHDVARQREEGQLDDETGLRSYGKSNLDGSIDRSQPPPPSNSSPAVGDWVPAGKGRDRKSVV